MVAKEVGPRGWKRGLPTMKEMSAAQGEENEDGSGESNPGWHRGKPTTHTHKCSHLTAKCRQPMENNMRATSTF